MTQIPRSALRTYDPGPCTACGGKVIVTKSIDVTTNDDTTPQVIPSEGRCTACGNEPLLS